MIKFHDVTDTFTRKEQDSFVCFSRLFLENIFKNSHSQVYVNIFLKPKSDAVFPFLHRCSGLTNRVDATNFNVCVFLEEKDRVIYAISHELVHIKQLLEDGFRFEPIRNKIYWHGRFYMKFTDWLKIYRDKNIPLFKELPWEEEAFSKCDKIFDSVSLALKAELSTDPCLRDLMKRAMKEPEYVVLD